MKTVNFEQYKILIDRNCKKGKHRPLANEFGVTWCTVCGNIMKDCVPTNMETHLPENTNEQIIISNNNEN